MIHIILYLFHLFLKHTQWATCMAGKQTGLNQHLTFYTINDFVISWETLGVIMKYSDPMSLMPAQLRLGVMQIGIAPGMALLEI